MRYLSILFSVATLLCTTSCIENDLPYPVIEVSITDVQGEGFSVAGINRTTRTVTLTLEEQTDIRKVRINKVTFDTNTTNPVQIDKETLIGMITTSPALTGEFDMRVPIYATLTLYQDYQWTIQAEQPIERSFTVAGQIGSTEIEVEKRTAKAYVAEDTDLNAITVTSLKLGPADVTTYSPTAEELSEAGFESMRFVDVTYHGTTERWMLYVLHTNQNIAFREVDLWQNTGVITARVTPEDYPDAEIQYRLKGTETWHLTQKGELDENNIFTGSIAPAWTSSTNAAGLTVQRPDATKGVFAGQTYELRLLVGGEQSELIEYTAPGGDTIPDGNMENTALSCFTSKNTDAEFWASGNNSFATALCTQSSYSGMGGSYCAKLTAASPPIVDLAAGNLMAGTFRKDGISTGVVAFGQPYTWTARPTGMKVKYHAKIGIVDKAKHSGAPIGKGDQDMARVFVAIVDWSARHDVSSGTGAPKGVWDPERTTAVDEGAILAYGSLFIDKSTEGDSMVEATIPIYYYNTGGRPTGKYSVVISSATSAYGDFMTGCSTNVLYLDDFEWVY
ncbi:PCMD domain-containing protein [uncultured Alistipes sp.]|uniref:PCMD domain-containing protein n=1 Tax=uncultured Alistipes sp. TaxID=538949 RepID=UPI0025EEA02C|nr:PCMD domain-containing protein [uncultured Alistipes sp.]